MAASPVVVFLYRQGVGDGIRDKNFLFPNQGIVCPTLPRSCIFISENGFPARVRKSAFIPSGRFKRDETENQRNCCNTSAASTILVSHLCQSSALGIWVFSAGLYYRMYSPSFLPISSRIAAVPVDCA